MKLNKKDYLSLIVIFVLSFMLNVLNVKTGSDYSLLTSSFLNSLSSINIFTIISYILVRLPKLISSLINTLVFISLVLLISKDKKDNLFFNFCVLFISIPYFGYTILSKSTSSEYLYLVTYLYLLLYLSDKFQKKYFLLPLYLLLGLNSLSIVPTLVIVIHILYLINFNNKSYLSNLLCGFIGGKGLNIVFTSSYKNFVSIPNLEALDIWMFVILVCIFVYTRLSSKLVKNEKINSIVSICLLIGIVIVNKFISKDLIDMSFLLVLFIVSELLKNIDDNNKEARNIIIKVALIFMCFNYYYAFLDNANLFIQNRQRESYIGNQIVNGNINPTIKEYNRDLLTKYNSLYVDEDINDDRDSIINNKYSLYRGINSIRTTTKKEYEAIFENGLPTLMNIQDIYEYISYIKDNDITFFITTSNLSDEEYESFKEVLSNEYSIDNLEGKHILIIGKGNNIEYIVSNEGEYGYDTQSDNGDFIYLCSLDYEAAYSIISINDTKYTLDYDGVKFVSYDENSKTILDSVVFSSGELKANR